MKPKNLKINQGFDELKGKYGEKIKEADKKLFKPQDKKTSFGIEKRIRKIISDNKGEK